jgi:hypothetical protein
MTNWLENNKKTVIRLAFLIPIISVAMISISHVIGWYDLANPATWAIYLSVAVEIAAMSAIAAASVRIKGFSVWFVFGIVTLIQFIGNIYFSYVEIDVTSQGFKDWMDLIAPITDAMGSSAEDIVAQRRFLAILEGGLLPLISLTCLHFFIGYGEGQESQVPIPSEPTTDSTPTDTLPEKEPIDSPQEVSNEADSTTNIEQTPQIDSIEETVESSPINDGTVPMEPVDDSEMVDYLQKPEEPARSIGVKVEQLSQKMKKILGK